MRILLRSCLAAGTILATLATAAAQDYQFGAKAGPSFAVVSFNPDQGADYDRRISADGGGFAVLPIASPFGLQLEALINSRGAKLYDPEEDLTGSVLFQYLDFPVLARINGPRRGARTFHVFGGPYAGIRLSAKRQISSEVPGFTTGVKENMSDEVERFEFGLIGGAGIEIGRRIVIDGRYAHGLSTLNRDRSDGVRIRNRAISFMAGVRF